MEISDKHDIPSFHGLYKITRSGEVYSVRGSKFLKQAIDRYGYPKVVLTAGGKVYYRTVHRLVAETFIPNTRGKPCVNHINEDKRDNRVENLEWCDWKENANHGTRNERMAASKCHAPVKRKLGTMWQWFIGVKSAAQLTGVNRGQIAKCCRGKAKTAGGYEWRYLRNG